MYERSAIVLERYFENLFGFNKQYNLKENYKNYAEFLEEFEKYQESINNEETIIKEFDEVANEIQNIQKTQEKLSESNTQLENERIKLFNDLDEDPSLIEKKLISIEENIIHNNEELESLRVDFIKYLKGFSERQKERNKYTKARRIAESTHMNFVKNVSEYLKNIDLKDIKRLNDFYNSDNSDDKKSLIKIMSENGKSERIKFNQEVLEKAITARINFAREELQCYILIYDRTRKLLKESENDNVKLSKYQKTLRDVTAKLNFINAEKDYIVGFLDNERMTAMNGPKVHQDMMKEACRNFDLDIIQIKNLYDLLIKEITGKATKKLYKELYNNTYLKEIEEKEKDFEKEVSNINIVGTLINSNYWRLEGIKNIYEVFENEITENFDRDLSEFKIQEQEEEENIEKDYNQEIFAVKNEEIQNNNDEEDDIDYDVYDYEEDEDEYADDEKDDEDEYDDYDNYDDEEDDEDYDSDEYEDDEEDNDEDDYDEEDDEEDNDEDDYDEEDDKDYDNDYDDEDEYEEYEDDEEDSYIEDDEDDDEDEEDEEEYEENDEDDQDDEDDIFGKYKKSSNRERTNKNIATKRNRRKNDIYDMPKIDQKQEHRSSQNLKKLEAKKDIYKNNKTGIFRNILGKMKNENK